MAEQRRTAVEPIRTARTFEAAIEHIMDAIERARLRTGDRLPNEEELAAALGISRPTLRQALRVLESAGLLSVRRGAGGGIFVISDLVPLEALTTSIALEEEVIVDVLRARRVLESAVARHAMHVMSEDDVSELDRTVDLLRGAIGNRNHVMRADGMFHRAVVRAAHSRTLEAAMRAIGRHMAPIRDAYSGGVALDRKTLEVHEHQLAAMRERDTEALEGVLEVHFGMLEDVVAAQRGVERDALFGVPVTLGR